MHHAPKYFIGLMSGTSADGIDAALVEFKDEQILLRGFISPELPSSLKRRLIHLNESPTIHLEAFCQLSSDIAQQFIHATQQLLTKQNMVAESISAIGSHGQTIYHAPHIPMTLQIGHPALIAKATAIQTAGDFRVDDMALNGQGAPFAPAFHQVLFQQDSPCFVVNIGGIANISYLPGKNDSIQAPLGCDTGPGNALMDEMCQEYFDRPFDQDGQLAKHGKINHALLAQLLEHAYFSQPQPKSTGRETFNINWLKTQLEDFSQKADSTLSNLDLISTLNALTSSSIATEIQHVIQQQRITDLTDIPVWIVGGGAFNQQLIKGIQDQLIHCKVQSSQVKQINPNAIEAMMCAWLAKQRIDNQPVALSQVTGASSDAVLGGLWHP